MPIIEDETITLGEVWLPPVIDDRDPGDRLDTKKAHMLVDKLIEDEGSQFVEDYVQNKSQICVDVGELERAAVAHMHEGDKL